MEDGGIEFRGKVGKEYVEIAKTEKRQWKKEENNR